MKQNCDDPNSKAGREQDPFVTPDISIEVINFKEEQVFYSIVGDLIASRFKR
ncbi:hypothetical protein ACQ4M3_07820 [Leptolyngbya sp. AN03gr2]|uniref:hypothetical protein n=1 Tax=unclassified Leptolyngbya TaxID=2650499 RepID=UPI003D30FC4D